MKSKHITLFLGLFIFLIGIIGYVNLYSQSKININNVDKQYLITTQINTIGNKTIDKIIKNQPYKSMEDINAVKGIGKVKYNTLSKTFCTYDTCRFEYYILGISICIILIVVGALLIIYYFIKKEKDEMKKKQLSKELKYSLDKNIKK